MRERLVWDALVFLHCACAGQDDPEPPVRLGHQGSQARHFHEITRRVRSQEVIRLVETDGDLSAWVALKRLPHLAHQIFRGVVQASIRERRHRVQCRA